MCTVCGCNTGSIEASEKEQAHHHAPARAHREHAHAHGEHAHAHEEAHAHVDHPAPPSARGGGALDFGAGLAGVHVPGLSQERIVRIERDILSKNDAHARDNRAFFAARGILALNLVSSPGSGKTTLLVRAIAELQRKFPVAVIEGDQQTSNDAERIRATGAPAIQINTGKGCHLDAHMIGHALERLEAPEGGVLFIENVGNLVCPAAFDLGEAHKIVVLSVTEGEDKPLKYPDMFAAADLMLLNKADLLPHLSFDVGACLAHALRVNPRLQTLLVSAQTGEGMAALYAWIEARVRLAAASAAAARAG